jgi:hypothetical protein
VLIGRAEVEDVVQPLGKTSLDLLPAGQIPPNPSELLGSMAMAELLERLSASYDMVLLDSPPLLPVTDAVVLSNLAGGALVVVGVDRIHRPQLQQSLESLETAGAHLFGIVMNKIARRELRRTATTAVAPLMRQSWNARPRLRRRPSPGSGEASLDFEDTFISDKRAPTVTKRGWSSPPTERADWCSNSIVAPIPPTDTAPPGSGVEAQPRLEFRP